MSSECCHSKNFFPLFLIFQELRGNTTNSERLGGEKNILMLIFGSAKNLSTGRKGMVMQSS